MKRRFRAYIILILIISMLGYHVYKVIELNRKIIAATEQKNAIIKIQRDSGSNQLDYYKNLSSRSISLLTQEQLIELAKTEWSYKLVINGQEFKGDSIKIEGQELNMTLVESRSRYSVLPEELIIKGKITDYFYKQIKIESQIPPEITNNDEEYSTSIFYKFSYLTHGDKIKISLSDELSKRLSLKNKTYMIYIK